MPAASSNMSAEERGRHNFERMLRALFPERAFSKAAQAG
jgi:hypothetical protein